MECFLIFKTSFYNQKHYGKGLEFLYWNLNLTIWIFENFLNEDFLKFKFQDLIKDFEILV